MNEHEHPDLLDDALDALPPIAEHSRQTGESPRCPICMSPKLTEVLGRIYTLECQYCGYCW